MRIRLGYLLVNVTEGDAALVDRLQHPDDAVVTSAYRHAQNCSGAIT